MPAILRGAPALLLATACAHAPRADVMRPAATGDCEAAAALATRPPGRHGDRMRRAVTAPASWLAVGTAYTTDVSVTLVGGAVVAGVGCLPLLLVDGALGWDDGPGSACAQVVAESIWRSGFMQLGPHAVKETRSWRCLDPTAAARETLAVARCFSARGWLGDEDVARTLLTVYRADRERFACTPGRLRREIDGLLDEITPSSEDVPAVDEEAGADADDLAAEEAAAVLPPEPPPEPATTTAPLPANLQPRLPAPTRSAVDAPGPR